MKRGRRRRRLGSLKMCQRRIRTLAVTCIVVLRAFNVTESDQSRDQSSISEYFYRSIARNTAAAVVSASVGVDHHTAPLHDTSQQYLLLLVNNNISVRIVISSTIKCNLWTNMSWSGCCHIPPWHTRYLIAKRPRRIPITPPPRHQAQFGVFD
jgi:hypothetical protein